MKKCPFCEKEFESSTAKQKFCSDACRNKAHRKNEVVEQTKTPNGFLKGQTIFVEEFGYERVVGQCSYCKRDVSEGYGDNWDLVRCCYTCTAERNKIKRELYPAEKVAIN